MSAVVLAFRRPAPPPDRFVIIRPVESFVVEQISGGGGCHLAGPFDSREEALAAAHALAPEQESEVVE
jgi:hypothetical protein